MQIENDFYQDFPMVHWDTDEEERAMALPRNSEIYIKSRIWEYQREIIAASVEVPGDEGQLAKSNLMLLQGKLLALQELLEDSRNAHGALDRPNE